MTDWSDLPVWRDAWCPWCGDRLPEDRDPRRLYCGRACHVAYFNDLRRERLEKARAGRTCAECGATFTRLKSNAIYCGRPCAKKASNRVWNARRKG